MLLFGQIVFFMIMLFSFALNFVHYMHMFQLNSYNAGEQLKWIKENLSDVVWRHIGALCAALILGLTGGSALGFFLASGAIVVFLLFALPKKAKKKLVFTPRVIRMCVPSIVIYGGFCSVIMLLMPATPILAALLPLAQIFSLVAAMAANFINKPVERAVNNHYINDAKRIISELPNCTVIGITGSYGKTSTKYYLNALLSAKFNVLMTPESYNTTMGVVKTIRGSLNATHEIFICEMGAKNLGEIKEICDIVHPKHSMITSIGPQHLESFKSINNIITTKFEITDCLTDGTAFLNYDNDYIREHFTEKHVVSYGIGANATDYHGEVISVSERGTEFRVTAPNGETKEFVTKLIGANNVQNIVGAIAVAHTLGVSFEQLSLPVRRLECVPHRLQIIEKASCVVIDDAFNSNPTGAKAALDTLAVFDGMKILVTPGMIELGEKEFELNREFGRQAAHSCDYAVLVGEKQAVPINEGLLSESFPSEKIFIVHDLNEGLARVDAIKSDGRKKIVLLENDLPDNF